MLVHSNAKLVPASINQSFVLPMKFSFLYISLFVILFSNYNVDTIGAQNLGDWQTYVSHADARFIAPAVENRIWAATGGGIIQIDGSDVAREYTMASGLYRVNATAITYDVDNDYIWQGYDDGTIERVSLSSGSIAHYGDIRRTERYSSRGINSLQMIDGYLYIATDFGIIVFDPQTGLVRDQFTRLGEFNSGLPVNDIEYYEGSLIAATQAGVAIGDLDDELDIPSSWQNYDQQDGLPDANINLIASWQNQVLAFSSEGAFTMEEMQWVGNDYFEQQNITSVTVSEEGTSITAVTPEMVFFRDDQGEESWSFGDEFPINSSFYNENTDEFFIGTADFGVVQFNRQTGEMEEEILPGGPFSNFFTDLNMDGSTLIAGSRNATGRSGFYIFSDNDWQNYHRDSSGFLGQNNIRRFIRTGVTESSYYFGSFGQGIVRFDKESGEMQNYTANNSPIQGFEFGSNYTVIGGIAPNPDGTVWLASWTEQQDAIYRYDEESEELEVFNKPGSIVGDARIFGLKRDSAGQLWAHLTDDGFDGRGLAVMREGENGIEGVQLTEDGTSGNLPSESINDVAEDNRGEVFIATNDGVANFAFPDRIIGGSAQDRQASLLLNADTTAASSFLLHNVHANAIEVNAANQKWIGTENAGLWLISPVGGRYEVVEHFTSDNSPLISDSIISLTLDEETGTLYIATDLGLMSYVGTTKAGVEEMEELFVYPNPYSYREQEGNIIIEGLADATKLNVLTADGRVVDRIETRGGRIEWDARDFQGNRVGSGVYVLVAVDEDNDERGTGKVVIIR